VWSLSESNFEDTVLNSEDLWLVFFHKNVKSEDLIRTVESTANALRNMVSVGAIDSKEIANKYSINGFPSF